jgi:hypothetical protein
MSTKLQILRKDKTLSALTEARQKLLNAVSKISDEDQDVIFLGVWSIRDLLAHLIGWDHTNIDAIKSVMQNQVPAFYQYRDRDWQTYNAMLVKKYKRGSIRKLLTTTNNSHDKLIRFLRTIPPEVFNKDFGVRFRGYKVTIQRLVEADTKDVQIHYGQITAFFKESK